MSAGRGRSDHAVSQRAHLAVGRGHLWQDRQEWSDEVEGAEAHAGRVLSGNATRRGRVDAVDALEGRGERAAAWVDWLALPGCSLTVQPVRLYHTRELSGWAQANSSARSASTWTARKSQVSPGAAE